MKTPLIFCLFTAFSLTGLSRADEKTFDILVYGATGGGVAAAVEAGRLGKSVALIEPLESIGGMTAGGLGATDIGSKTSIIGLSREFYHRIWEYYRNPSAWVYETREEYKPKHHDAISDNLETHWFFEPKVASQILKGMLSEAGVKVFTGERLVRDGGIKKEGTRIETITMESGKVFHGKAFIDASYEGDLMAGAGVSYFVGREANSQYDETLNGSRPRRFTGAQAIDPYKIPGDSGSGILPGIESVQPKEPGTADKRVQAYTFRVCLTDAQENRIPVAKPDSYDPAIYEIHLRGLLANPEALPGKDLFKLTPMPNRKTDSNNKGMYSTDFIGRSWEWAEAGYARRDEIWKEHADYVQGFLWFLGNDPRVPEAVRKETLRWGLPKDEFAKTGHWPFQLYVREARRMTGGYVITEHDCRRTRIADDGIVLASYSMDSHSTSRFVDEEGKLGIEGSFLVRVSPYPVSYRAIVPKETECTNLLVPVCLSASHVAYGSIRMEPVFMMLGQASAYAASLAIDESTSVQSVPVARIRDHIGSTKQIAAIKPASEDDPKKSPSAAGPNDVRFRKAVAGLKKSGILKGDMQWIENTGSEKSIDGAKVGELLINFAKASESVDSIDSALKYLGEENILADKKGYWKTNARAGKTCSHGQVMYLVIRLGQFLPR